MHAPLRWLALFVLALLWLFPPAPPAAAQVPDKPAADLRDCAATIAYGDVMSCAINQAGEVDTITFTAAAGDTAFVRVGRTAGNVAPAFKVIGPDNLEYCASGSPNRPFAGSPDCTLTTAGTYSIQVRDAGGSNTGLYNVYLQHHTRPVNDQPLAVGETTSATLVHVAAATTYTLQATAGEQLLVRLGIVAGTMHPAMHLFDPTGTRVCGNSDNYYRHVEMACTIPQTGTYTVYVHDNSGIQTGAYNLYAQWLTTPRNAQPLPLHQMQTDSIIAPAAATTYTLTGNAGDVLLLREGIVGGKLKPAMRLYNREGVYICGNSSSYYTLIEVGRCVLPATGTYTLLVNDDSGIQTGTYTLFVQSLSAPVGASPLTLGAVQLGSVSQSSELNSYTFNGAAGDSVQLRMAVVTGSMRPQMRLYSPDGIEVCGAAESYSTGTEVFRCLLPVSGTYLLLVNSPSLGTGTYHVQLQRLVAHPTTPLLTLDSGYTGSLQAAETVVYQWYAAAADRLSFEMTRTSGTLRPMVRIFDPDGIELCYAYASSSGASTTLEECRLPRAGSYTVMVASYAIAADGGYTFTASCLNAECGGDVPTTPTVTVTPPVPVPTASPTATVPSLPDTTRHVYLPLALR